MNTSNASYCKYDDPESASTTAFKVTAIVLVSALGIFGNVFIIVLALKYTVRKNLHHLIINMAVSDTVFIAMILFFVSQHLSKRTFSFYPGGTLGMIICKSTFFLIYVSCPVSFLTLLAISVERFRVTRTTLHRSRPYSLQQRIIVLGAAWLIPMAFFAFLLRSGTVASDSNVNICKIASSSIRYTLMLFFINHHLIITLFIIILTLSLLTIRRLSKAKAFKANFNKKQQKLRARRIKSAVYMVLSSVLLSSCCWLPYFIYSMLGYLEYLFDKKMISSSSCIDLSSLHFITVYFLPLVNSAFGPCIYIIFLSDFRQAAVNALCGKATSQRRASGASSFALQPLQASIERRRRMRRENEHEKVTTFSSVAMIDK